MVKLKLEIDGFTKAIETVSKLDEINKDINAAHQAIMVRRAKADDGTPTKAKKGSSE